MTEILRAQACKSVASKLIVSAPTDVLDESIAGLDPGAVPARF